MQQAFLTDHLAGALAGQTAAQAFDGAVQTVGPHLTNTLMWGTITDVDMPPKVEVCHNRPGRWMDGLMKIKGTQRRAQ